MMEENKITAITKEKTDVLKDAYKDTLEMLDAYDHCKCQYKNVGFISYKRVGKPTCLYDIF